MSLSDNGGAMVYPEELRMNRRLSAIGSSAVIIVCGVGQASPIAVSYDEPTLDRWVYPFNATPGVRGVASVFSAFFEDFDDRDAQFLIGFDTSMDIPAGMPTCSYSVTRAVVTVENLNNDIFAYDDTVDGFRTYLPDDDAEFVPDEDAGRPLEIYGVGYRNGFDASTFFEDSPFGVGEPSERTRNVFASDNFDGLLEDVSNNVTDRFETVPFAVGVNDSLTPGQIVPADIKFMFDLDVQNADVQSYLGDAISRGELRLMVSSLQPAAQAPGGGMGGDGVFAAFYTRENLIQQLFGGRAATLELEVEMVKLGDVNGSGSVNFSDLVAMLGEFGPGSGPADVNCDGNVNFSDLVATLALFD